MSQSSIEDYVDLWQQINALRGKVGAMKNRDGRDYEREAMQAVYVALNQAAKSALAAAQQVEEEIGDERE